MFSKSSVSGRNLADKINELMPDQKLKISPELLNDTCKQPAAQPFLKWFYENIGPENILLKKETELKKNLQANNEWLTGDALDDALAEATKDCPELLRLLECNRNIDTDIVKAYEAEKNAYETDIKDLRDVQGSLKTLKQLEIKQDESIEKEEIILEKLQIEEHKIYNECSRLVEEFNSAHHVIQRELERLLEIYRDAAEKRGPITAWTQLPLELFVKQTEVYNNCLKFYKKREFKAKPQDSSHHSGLSGLTEDSTTDNNDKAHELLQCQINSIQSTLNEIEMKVERYGCEAVLARVIEIYNNNHVKVPQTETQLNVEITELLSRRDLLEENIRLLTDQLKEYVHNYSKFEVLKILVSHGEARLDRRNKRLEKFQYLLHLARDMGHSQSNLLLILNLLQNSKLEDLINFVSGFRHYLNTEYTLSAKRCAAMENIQTKYSDITLSSPSKQNVYHKLFSSLIIGDDTSADALDRAINKYDELISENQKLKDELLNEDLDEKIANLQPIENQVMAAYNRETSNGPTRSFKIKPEKRMVKLEEAEKNVEHAQTIVSEARNKYKTMVNKIIQCTIEREKTILWQRFVADPDGLKVKYEDVQREIDRSHFVQSLDS